jgi:hypothetical protein
MKKSPNPLSLQDTYFYNHNLNIFLNDKGKELTGRQIVDAIFKEHCNTVHALKGFKIRFKLRIQSIAIKLCSFLINVLKILLKYPLGKTLDEKRDALHILQDTKERI